MSIPATSSARAQGSSASPRRPEPRGRFEEALARAKRPADRRGEPVSAAPAGAQRQLVRPPARTAPAERGRDAETPLTPGSPAEAGPKLAAPLGICELQAAIRAAPPAIAAALRQGQPQLALGFGTALSIDLRAGAQGLEVSLRPSPALERAARAELPGLVEALRARGLRVARAEVRGPPGQARTSRAR